MPSGIEIERKFLLDGLPPTMRLARRERIRQGYVATAGATRTAASPATASRPRPDLHGRRSTGRLASPAMAKLSDSASTDIDAPIGAVWAIVEDVAAWPEWQATLGSVDILERNAAGQ